MCKLFFIVNYAERSGRASASLNMKFQFPLKPDRSAGSVIKYDQLRCIFIVDSVNLSSVNWICIYLHYAGCARIESGTFLFAVRHFNHQANQLMIVEIYKNYSSFQCNLIFIISIFSNQLTNSHVHKILAVNLSLFGYLSQYFLRQGRMNELRIFNIHLWIRQSHQPFFDILFLSPVPMKVER